MAVPDDGLLEVGRVGRPHGVRGELYLDLTSDRAERAEPGARLLIGERWFTVAASRPSGGRWLVRLDGVEGREAAAALTNTVVRAEPLDDGDVWWVHDLIGAAVVEVDGTPRGRCVSVIDNPAADVLELDTRALVPVNFVVSVADGVITIDPPDGLFDVG